ncbi:hypothetical protein ACIPSE_31990 [Streptomyces sp. NPDC090106]|uniref:hypothetical protein n=1 Tax=Streptomyces sp. NPDC090106 TaxID=3365946 RepID=UPI0038198556
METGPRSTVLSTPHPCRDYPVSTVVTLERNATARLLRGIRHHHVMPAYSHPWGSGQAYLDLLRDRDSLTLLDAPGTRTARELEQRVRVLSTLSQVVVLTEKNVEPVSLLRAGAANVLFRDTPPRELASRLTAERRWLDSAASGASRGLPASRSPTPVARPPRFRQQSQQVLAEVLTALERPWCCHELCLLLGDAEDPLNRRALHARIGRLDESLAAHGLSVRSTGMWGRTSYGGIHPVYRRALNR